MTVLGRCGGGTAFELLGGGGGIICEGDIDVEGPVLIGGTICGGGG